MVLSSILPIYWIISKRIVTESLPGFGIVWSKDHFVDNTDPSAALSPSRDIPLGGTVREISRTMKAEKWALNEE